MSKSVELAYAESRKSEIRVTRNGSLEITNAAVFWKDFQGRPNEQIHRKAGDVRSFNLALNDQMLELLKNLELEQGIKIRVREAKMYSDEALAADPNLQQYMQKYVNIKVKFNPEARNPLIMKLFTEYRGEKNVTDITEENACVLDAADIERWDIIIRVYSSSNNKSEGYCSLYLSRLYAVQNKEAIFGGIYDDWNKVSDDEEPMSAVESIEKDMAACNPATGDNV